MKRLALALIICATSAHAGALKEVLTFKVLPSEKVRSGEMVFNVFDHKREATKVLVQLQRHHGGKRGKALKAELATVFPAVSQSIAASKGCRVVSSKALNWNTVSFVMDC